MAKKTAKRKTIADQLRLAITNSGKSLYQLSIESGVDSGQLSRFMNRDRSLTLESVDKLAVVLNLSLL